MKNSYHAYDSSITDVKINQFEYPLITALMTVDSHKKYLADAYEAINTLKISDFINPDARILFAAISKLNKQNLPFDFVTVSCEVDIGLDQITEMTKSSLSHPSHIHLYVDAIKKASHARHIVKQLTEVLEEGKDLTLTKFESFNELAVAAANAILDNTNASHDIHAIGDIVNECIEAQDKRLSGDLTGKLYFNIPSIDEALRGINEDDLVTIAGASGMGKTELMILLAMQAGRHADTDGPVIFSLEMGRQQIVDRMVAIEADVTYSALQELGAEEVASSYGKFVSKNSRGFVYDGRGVTSDVLRNLIMLHVIKHKKTTAIFIDHFSAIHVQKNANLTHELGNTARMLKALARQIKVPIILLAQVVTKDIDKRLDKRPNPSDIKYSSDVQDNSDVILCPYREGKYDPDSPFADVAEINVAKGRHNDEPVIYMGSKNRHFVELSPERKAEVIQQKRNESMTRYDMMPESFKAKFSKTYKKKM